MQSSFLLGKRPSSTSAEGLLAGEKVSLHLFKSERRDLYFGGSEPWTNFGTSRRAFEFDSYNNTLTIKQDGLYLFYVQVSG